MKERLRIQGLRKRWILNSVGPVILILVLAAILASATVANNYYGSARSTLEAKAKAITDSPVTGSLPLNTSMLPLSSARASSGVWGAVPAATP